MLNIRDALVVAREAEREATVARSRTIDRGG